MKRCHARAFSLLEMLVVIAVIAVLLAILLPAMHSCRSTARNVKCMANQRIIAQQFRDFADPMTVTDRGYSGPGHIQFVSEKLFRLRDFAQKMYRVDYFWDEPDALPRAYKSSQEPMICPESTEVLYREKQAGLGQSEVSPTNHISIALNRRLERLNIPVSPIVYISEQILDHPMVPIAFDVDRTGASSPQDPYFAAPPLPGIDDSHADGRYWYPTERHGGRLNVAFVGGHVASTRNPLEEPGWDWSYTP